jgi:hypothetical protein
MFIIKCVIGRLLPFKKEGIEFRECFHLNETSSNILDSESNNILKSNSVKKKSTFRLTAKQLFLTYSDTKLEKNIALIQLQSILQNDLRENPIKNYIIAQKQDQNGTFTLYAYLALKDKINIISPTKLDLKIPGTEQIIHGKYETVKKKSDIINFLKESGNYITDLVNDKAFYIELYNLAKNYNLDTAINYLENHRPEWISTRFKNIRANLQAYIKINKKTQSPSLKNNCDEAKELETKFN